MPSSETSPERYEEKVRPARKSGLGGIAGNGYELPNTTLAENLKLTLIPRFIDMLLVLPSLHPWVASCLVTIRVSCESNRLAFGLLEAPLIF